MQLGSWSIDSLKVRIPLRKVKILDESIRELVYKVSQRDGKDLDTSKHIYDSDGVLYKLLDEQQNTKSHRDEKGIKTTFSIEQRATKFDTIPYLIILVNAKQLGSIYFQGITTHNLTQLHKYLMSLDIAQFSLKELLYSECTDIDIKKDFEAPDERMKEVFKAMKDNATPSEDYDKGCKLFWKKDNKGLQFNKRETTKYLTAPFLKIYSKTSDLLTKSNIFAMAYLDNIPQDLWRIEYTIKNKKHLQSFEIGNTFAELLSLSQEQLEAISQKSLKAVLEKRIKPLMELNDNIPPRDLMMVNSLIMLLDSGHQWTIIKKQILGSLEGKNKSVKGKLLDTLFESYIKPIEGYSKHQAVDDILNQIGYNF
jgi:hypothetical protein